MGLRLLRRLVHYRLVQAAILKREEVLAVFSESSFNTLREIFQDLMLLKSQQVFASAYKDIQGLIWNFHS